MAVWPAACLVLCLVAAVLAYPNGAPDRPSICASMKPGHSAPPMKLPPPFTIEVSSDRYYADDSLTVTIRGRGDFRFKGFFIQARRADWRFNQTEPLGSFSEIPGSKVICQERHGNGLTHIGGELGSDLPKNELVIPWRAPDSSKGHIQFRVTIVSTYADYWVAERSLVIQDPQAAPIPTRQPPMSRVSQIPGLEIDVDECGKKRGCYREPRGCKEAECEAIVSWSDQGDHVEFLMSANTNGWVALGFSEDKRMGHDSVVMCVWKEQESAVDVRAGYNDGKHFTELDNVNLGLSDKAGVYSGGRVKCRFRRVKTMASEGKIFDLNNAYHILLGNGPGDEDGTPRMHNLEPFKFPMVSPRRVSIKDNINIYGRARYPLVKAHGCLMLVAWMMCGALAIIMGRYYQPMWPNDRFCGKHIWFAVHRACIILAMIFCVIGFILIFIHVGGYSKLPELPAKAHPPIGIVVTILAVLVPLIALCRCDKDHRLRPIFNWIYWFLGTVCFVLAIPNLFIGLSMYKSFVPWWATWVMAAFFLFHVICELMLEIHGCINGPKQKRHDQEYQLTKKARGDLDGYEPNPVGTRFKTTIISIYLVVMVILGLVMVITVAVS